MSLISIQRSPTPDDLHIPNSTGECDNAFELESNDDHATNSSAGRKSRSPSECYFTVRGAAVILSHPDQASVSPRTESESEIHSHLQAMLRLLRPEDTLSMAVRLQSTIENHARYLAILSTLDASDTRETALIGFDFLANEEISIGITVPINSTSKVGLDGDGGITVIDSSSIYLFKPISIQSMWSFFQSLHKELAAQIGKTPFFPGNWSHRWLDYYTYRSCATTDDAICASWHYSIVDDESKGDLRAVVSAEPLESRSSIRVETEAQINAVLKHIMQSVDLDDVTSQDIRKRLVQQLPDIDMAKYKEFVDREMLVILGQMDKPSRILDYLYLGTEWNASNWDELKENKVEYILNVTKEVDNFFPTQFKYLKIWVSDEASTELLMHWQRTYDFIKEAKERGKTVLVHCRKGISRSASTVVAYSMKEYGWPLEDALDYVKKKRNCITPNHGFMAQLATFNGVLQASNNRHSAVFNPMNGSSKNGTIKFYNQNSQGIKSKDL